ncbi:MAG: regulatory protein TetR [Gemmatimonadetes bacterium]|nr:regulatory protein TetR [Gemmatimonadota bacterium]
MAKAVKRRSYDSPLRADQARLTSRAIVSAAAALFGEKGYAAVSLDAVAELAGVSRATVFTSVGGKAALLKDAFGLAFGRAAGAPDQSMPLVDRPRSREIRARPDARDYLAGYAGLCTALHRHMAGVYEAIREGAHADAEVGALWVDVNAERRRGAATIVADVKARAPLRADLDDDEAADVVWVLNDPVHFHMLVTGRRWSEEKFEKWLTRALEAELLGGERASVGGHAGRDDPGGERGH